MQKATIKISDSQRSKFRLIVNTSEDHSVGIILSRAELSELFFEAKDLLEAPDEIASNI